MDKRFVENFCDLILSQNRVRVRVRVCVTMLLSKEF